MTPSSYTVKIEIPIANSTLESYFGTGLLIDPNYYITVTHVLDGKPGMAETLGQNATSSTSAGSSITSRSNYTTLSAPTVTDDGYTDHLALVQTNNPLGASGDVMGLAVFASDDREIQFLEHDLSVPDKVSITGYPPAVPLNGKLPVATLANGTAVVNTVKSNVILADTFFLRKYFN